MGTTHVTVPRLPQNTAARSPALTQGTPRRPAACWCECGPPHHLPGASVPCEAGVFPWNSRGDCVRAWSPRAERQLRTARPGGGVEPTARAGGQHGPRCPAAPARPSAVTTHPTPTARPRLRTEAAAGPARETRPRPEPLGPLPAGHRFSWLHTRCPQGRAASSWSPTLRASRRRHPRTQAPPLRLREGTGLAADTPPRAQSPPRTRVLWRPGSRPSSVPSGRSSDQPAPRSVPASALPAGVPRLPSTARFLRGQSLIVSGVVFPLCLGDGVQGTPASAWKGLGVLEGQRVGVQD